MIIKAAKTENGLVHVVEVPMPVAKPQFIVVKMVYSALSTGTELMVIGNKSTGFLGNSGVGIVTEVGEGVEHIQPGQRVAIYGVATHAEYVAVPKHLAVPVPEELDGEEVAFTGLATIAIQALRQADLRFGESVAVIGLGILGQFIAQIAHAAAYEVLAIDLLEERCLLLEKAGVSKVSRTPAEMEENVQAFTKGHGVDCVMISAKSKKHRMIDQGLAMLRDRGKIVIVGDTDTTFERNGLFAKEASITISRAGGPGRYDATYEQEGYDYSYGYVRWTQGRNIEAYVNLLAGKRLNVKPLITHRFAFENIAEAYESAIAHPNETIGVVITYGE